MVARSPETSSVYDEQSNSSKHGQPKQIISFCCTPCVSPVTDHNLFAGFWLVDGKSRAPSSSPCLILDPTLIWSWTTEERRLKWQITIDSWNKDHGQKQANIADLVVVFFFFEIAQFQVTFIRESGIRGYCLLIKWIQHFPTRRPARKTTVRYTLTLQMTRDGVQNMNNKSLRLLNLFEV